MQQGLVQQAGKATTVPLLTRASHTKSTIRGHTSLYIVQRRRHHKLNAASPPPWPPPWLPAPLSSQELAEFARLANGDRRVVLGAQPAVAALRTMRVVPNVALFTSPKRTE